ncbi:ATP-binding protein [Kitasatospora paracochleata]|uniref:Signal transduction histidine kinase n=1 Tax=Kitasatospora paracochleata TaxID=58354 RepID=A0ABT1J4J4_9ACTN|nr:sensor histidine kinase [Kitasatospora paracochleata]MCP2311986.1 signal transduction histidine kinase [Kitasatospora paracochleata]
MESTVEVGAGGVGTDRAGTVEVRWDRFFRWGPYALLAAGTLLSAATAGLLMSRAAQLTAAGLVATALVLHLGRGTGRPAGVVHYVLRTVLAAVLTWLNPFFAVYAVLGYFDADRLLPRRAVRIGLVVTAATMAGSQSGGLPPVDRTHWIAFAALFALNSSLSLAFQHLSAQEAENVRAKAAAIAELEDANARLARALRENAGLHAQLLVQAREAGVADERRRLAAEIHDTIAQGLAGIVTQLQAATDSPDPDAARTHLDRAAALARHSLGEARRSVRDLGPSELEHDDLPAALAKVVDGWSAAAGVPAAFTVAGTVAPLHAELEGTLLRIAQEALANTARHARAGRVGVTLTFMDDEVSLDVRDDGRGFDPAHRPAPTVHGGFGLAGMRARAERVAGVLEVESEPGYGTAISARVPLVRHG